MSLSVAMIVKDEERDLRKCLESIKPIADELSIVDTGSTDSTVDIIRAFADEVDFPVHLNFIGWEEGGFFSGCRNYGLQFCTKRWIFWIDGDEWLYPECHDEVKQLVTSSHAYAAFAGLLSDLPDGRISKHYLPKFFRRGTAHFEGIVHNQVVHASPILTTGINIHHVGYALEPERMAKKRERTSGLLRKQIEEKPENAFAYMNLSRTLMNDQSHAEALEAAEKGLEYESHDACKQMLYYSVAVCAAQLGDFVKAEGACWKALSLNPYSLDMTFGLANIALAQKQWERALLYLNRYLQLKEQEDRKPVVAQLNFLIVDFYDARDKAYNLIGVCHMNLGHKDVALNAHRKAVQISPQPGLFKNLAIAYEQNGRTEDAHKIWYRLAEMGCVDDVIIGKLRNAA